MEKTFNAAEAEARIYAKWDRSGAFKAGANAKLGAEPFSIMIPPPNVTGVLHVGHAFNNTLQDVLTRWHRMRGFDTLWQPGTDHAGIATQMVVERELAKSQIQRKNLTREEFLAHVWEWKAKSGGTIREQLKRLGASCDWSREAFTMSGAPGAPEGEEGNFHDAVIKVFVEMYNKGYIYRGKRLVNWDPHFETAISDLEVENIDQPGHMWHFKYPLAGGATYEYVETDEDGVETLRETRDYISIATTRPETMLGDGAVAVHPDDTRYAAIVGQLCEIPVGPKEHRRLIPIITDDYPDPSFGSGAVKITGAHDFNDYEVAKRGNIPCYRLLDTKGALRDDGAPYAEAAAIAQAVANGDATLGDMDVDALNLVPDHLRGLDRFMARERIVEEITADGLAVMTTSDDPRLGAKPKKKSGEDAQAEEPPETEKPLVPLVEAKPITQPFGDRSKVVIEPMLTDQWFVDTAKIVEPALNAVRSGRTKIIPEQHRKVYFHWLENIEPWTISRQLWWGHQIPVWYADEMENGEVVNAGPMFCAATEQEALQAAQSHYGPKRVVLPESVVQQSGGRLKMDEMKTAKGNVEISLNLEKSNYVKLRRDPDVLDTWFSSGLWPIGTLGWPEQTPELDRYFPTSTLISGFDIIFFWVARMMMMQLAVVDDVPFRDVYVHALVRDEKGRKMSKSIGNVLDPLELIDEYGADALRFTLTAMAAMGRDLKLSTDRIQGYRNFGTKLWNAARFAEMNECVPDPAFDPKSPTQTVNKWIITETARARIAHDEALENYRFNDAAGGLYQFVWGKVCDWYLEFAKPLFASGDDAVIAETRATMAWVIDQCLILLHPTMPFITEELWSEIATRDTLLVHADWPTYGAEFTDIAAEKEMSWVIALIESIRSARQQMHVPAGLKVQLLQSDLDAAGQAAFDTNQAMITRLARLSEVTPTDAFPKGTVTIAVDGGTFGLPIADLIDVDEEKARLEKTLGKLAKELGGLRGRLNNPKFAESAPAEVVEETKANLKAREEEEARLKQALARLAEVG
ncbi:valine--tRNA ligase [Jannaschia sp. CCS1]|uniref:valine--tRNA ligase n=1 Tax=Jannaschia sp. (strain CCS1) TaxID=290400 RepID=UPI000053D653|nr:valine--tRNA ligase [Jannaschia sp. CCS1]ABD56394.1 valyl-tRNA synthetase [Jannaschia sp. CCS1]